MSPAALVPLTAASPREVGYYRRRLHDPALLERALGVEMLGHVVLAVPVGGRRQGGYISVSEIVTGEAVRNLLAGREGFPDVRMLRSPYADTCHSVRWGAPPPDDIEDGIVADGMHYGYSDEAIASHVRKYGRPPEPRAAPSRLRSHS
ncbi:DUF6302 family protein [Streptomyces californicus]|uniref:DUF6302 family protein n=1 Tax=Streptomyces californicus TaxID=67351 RepID=UPI00382F9954